MGYTNETTHYSIPLPVGSDLTTPMDYNQSFEAVDTALFTAAGSATTALNNAATALSTAQATAGDLTTLTGRVADDEANISTNTTAITGLGNQIGDVKQDLSDAICADMEATATAAHAHAVGDMFWYNNTLYRTTVDIGVGDTIVPNTNCVTTTVEAEISDVDITPTNVKTGVAIQAVKRNGNVVHIAFTVTTDYVGGGENDVLFNIPANDAPSYTLTISNTVTNGTTMTVNLISTGAVVNRWGGELPTIEYNITYII